ncbi:MAG: SGNH/GDSL hydrolase family protein [Bacteroidetes bacterium]|nr:SGNH/GDSL hydrolase family protein [Bacteroidota bacterium]MCW5897576.1 SGNH/GDSL hydrolase family protein [Bacteroidota bacterium]
MRKLFSTILLLLFSTIASLLIGEAMVRMVAPQRLQNTPAMFTPDDFLVFKLQPLYTGTYTTYEFETPISINSVGLRDNEIGSKQENSLRIVGLGDSFSFANGVTLEETYFKRVESRLSSAYGRPVELINCAVPSYSPLQSFRMLQKYGMAFDPDIVVLGFFVGNDFVESMDLFDAEGKPLLTASNGNLVSVKASDRQNERGIIRPLTTTVRAHLASHSHLYVFLRDRMSNMLSKAGLRPFNLPPEFCAKEYSPRMVQGWAITSSILRDLSEYVRNYNKRLVVVVLPAIYQVYTNSWSEYINALKLNPDLYDLDKPQKLLAEFCRDEGIEFVDALPALRSNSANAQLFFPVDGHPTKEGHEIISEVLASYLLNRR